MSPIFLTGFGGDPLLRDYTEIAFKAAPYEHDPFFTSDEHYGHKNIIGYCNRPFADVDAMTEGLIERHNARVGANDVVWHLGDFALDERLVPKVLPRLNGRHRLIPGNHDRCHPCHKKHEAARERYRDYGFVVVNPGCVLDDIFPEVGKRVMFSHLPSGDVDDPRYGEFRPNPSSHDVLLHGHVHDRWKLRLVGASIEINVGVDVWNYAPVRLSEIVRLIDV